MKLLKLCSKIYRVVIIVVDIFFFHFKHIPQNKSIHTLTFFKIFASSSLFLVYFKKEKYALQAVKSREMGLLEELEEERNPTVKGGEKKIIQHAPLPYDQDPRLQTLMEDSVSLLKNIQMKKFLTPWRFLIWKGT